MNRMINVKDMLKYAQEHNLKLLSNYSAVFWQNYLSNNDEYDKIFTRLYSSFYYFAQTDLDTIEDVTLDFIDAVKGHLRLNDKKYAELYRVNSIDDDEYKLLDNYTMTETMARTEIDNKGMRTDTTSKSTGNQTITSENDVSPYDTENFYNEGKSTNSIGGRSDTGSFVSGAQMDDKQENYTLTKIGNNGNYTSAEMIKKHINLWNDYEFYASIFSDISKELLALG